MALRAHARWRQGNKGEEEGCDRGEASDVTQEKKYYMQES